jgi:phenylalanyl-tRNA synthetase alpha chain
MRDLKGKIESLRDDFDKAAAKLQDHKQLEGLRNAFLGRKKGHLSLLITEIKSQTPAEKKEAGQILNAFKKHILDVLARTEEGIGADSGRGTEEDLTLPGSAPLRGVPHPIIGMTGRMEELLRRMGFSVHQGPEIEGDYYNFTGLDYPRFHPARGVDETLYIDEKSLLRTHAASVFLRIMEKQRPPLRVMTSGKVFRVPSGGEGKPPVAFQVGGVVIDLGINFSHLKGHMDTFLRNLFSERISLRYRPKYTPYNETGVEIDIDCPRCGGEGAACHACLGTGWTPVVSAGMMGPQILKNVNIDPEKYSGWTFITEVDRIVRILTGEKELWDCNYYENVLQTARGLSRILI